MYKISPYTPLFFSPSKDKGRCSYVQQFCRTDRILIEVIVTGNSAMTVKLKDHVTGKVKQLDISNWRVNDNTILYFYELYGLYDSFYSVIINDQESEVFHVAENVDNSVLLQYSMRSNKDTTDGVFFIDGMQYFFDFRIPGGFKDSEWQFSVDNEQYLTSENDLLDVYSVPNTQKVLTMGNSRGCPIWFAEMLNRILSCTYFYVDGERFSRKDASIPETNIINENSNSFVFKQVLQQVRYINPVIEGQNKLIMRRIGMNTSRKTPDSTLIKI